MFGYYLQLGLRSLRRNPILTALMVVGIALGIAASMTTLTVMHLMGSNPIPWKSDKLHYVQLDNWSPDQSYYDDGRPPDQVTYQDAVALSRQLDNASLVTFDAEGHTAFGRSRCATDAVVNYLVDLKVPASGTTCADETQPPSSTPKTAPPGTTLSELRNGVNERVERIDAAS